MMMMKSYNESVKLNNNPNRPYILDNPCKTLIIAVSGSGKTNVILNLIKHQRADIDSIYLCIVNPFELKY